jgi:hypothetical protein
MNRDTKKALRFLCYGLLGIAAMVLLVLSLPVILAKVLGIALLFAVMILGGALGTAPRGHVREKRKA